MRDWQGSLWAVRVRPRELRATDWDNAFVTAHRMMRRPAIEEWLGRLRLLVPPFPRSSEAHVLKHGEPKLESGGRSSWRT